MLFVYIVCILGKSPFINIFNTKDGVYKLRAYIFIDWLNIISILQI